MYVLKRQVTMQRGIATLLAIALVLWAVGTHMFTVAEAANLTYVKDTLSDSATSTASNHTIQFLSPTGVGNSATITVSFPVGFTGTSSVNEDDIDFLINGTDETVVDGAPAAGQWGVWWTGNTLNLVSGSAESLGSNATATILIGTNADTDGTGTAQITNPASIQSYVISITAGADSADLRVAILDNVQVTADVDTTLTFTVNGTSTGSVVNGSPTTTADNTTSNTLPFGTLVDSTSKTLGQDLTLATNARNGYVVTVEQDQDLQSTTGGIIDSFTDGTYVDTPAAWVAPGNNILDETTWGHWGLTTNDTSLLGAGSDFASDQWVAASTTPRAIMVHSGPADGVTLGIGRATIGYQVQITALQEAGDDYNTTLTYIATPTF